MKSEWDQQLSLSLMCPYYENESFHIHDDFCDEFLDEKLLVRWVVSPLVDS